ncbi:hypothetical protein BDV19DRAFT_358499 [Aspergillus venezuelensis]
MDDPASRVPGQLLPHMHLVSRNRYPLMHMMPTETAVEFLLSAPKVVREAQPMHWTFLDGPQDGTVMLTWQSLNHMGTNFASDGYVWADAEQAFTFEVRGYVVEMWLHRSGYHPPNESVAMHCRRRYRLVSTKIPNLPPPDPSLWIVHYCRAPPNDHIPANRIPVLPQIQSMLAQRRFLQSQGILARKDFMLHDRNNWPAIGLPPQMAVQQGYQQPQGPYPNAMAGRQPFYPPGGPGVQAPGGPVQAKAPRGHRASSTAVNAATTDFALEDEDVSAGDLMDLLTPREVSKMRYQQHHEWMEEVLASPFAISQITPVSLGLGRKGELESLTAGFFDAPVGPANGDAADKEAKQATKLEPEKAEEFADRVAKKVKDMTDEIEKLKNRHAQRMEKFNRTSTLKEAETKLRDAAADPAETGSEVWRLEGRVEIPTDEDNMPLAPIEHKAKYKVDDIVKNVEKSWNKQIVPEPRVSCIEKGGLLEKIEPEQKPSAEVDIDMDHADSHLLDQFTTQGNAGQPQQQLGSNPNAPGLQPTAAATGVTQQDQSLAGLDIHMDLGNIQPAGTAQGETGDWVMVDDKKGDTPGSGLQGLTPGNAGTDNGLDGANFDFTNMDSAGDALAAYTEQNDGLDLPDLENSAFGDAFHASDNENTHHHDADDMS